MRTDGITLEEGSKLSNVNLTDAVLPSAEGSIHIDWQTSQNYTQPEPTGAIVYTFTPPTGKCHLQLLIDSSGSNGVQTITLPGNVIWFGAAWTPAANKKSILTFWFDGTNYLAAGMNQV